MYKSAIASEITWDNRQFSTIFPNCGREAGPSWARQAEEGVLPRTWYIRALALQAVSTQELGSSDTGSPRRAREGSTGKVLSLFSAVIRADMPNQRVAGYRA